ncbi:MAG: hypothetical protein KIS76_13525 [Pyrinomonadaceae bacterium]|nr:hypothetical protein [Pyrinomonadaceae bacterium]
MTLVNELENDLAMAFFVEGDYSAKLKASEIVALFNRLRDSLESTFPEDEAIEENTFTASADSRSH